MAKEQRAKAAKQHEAEQAEAELAKVGAIVDVLLEKQPPAAPATQAELKAELDKVYASGDWKAIASVARKIDAAENAKEAAELNAKRAAQGKVEDKVKAVYLEAFMPMIDAGELDNFDGIWISHDFGEAQPVARITKTAPKATRSGSAKDAFSSSAGKKFDISTVDMLARRGTEQYKEGISYQQAWESTSDKNQKYQIRLKLLKAEGIV